MARLFDNGGVHPPHLKANAIAWHREGIAFGQICRRLGLPRGTVGKWLHGERSKRPAATRSCVRCAALPSLPSPMDQYAYLLGQYLGDGHIQAYARSDLLSVYCDSSYPGIIGEIDAAMRAAGTKSTRHRNMRGCTAVQSYWKHWRCLFPQAGAGKKHERKIEFADWQQEIVTAHPGKFVRGLFHSDGCRVINQVRVRGRLYAYPRYFLSNKSADILALCGGALDLLGVQWKLNRGDSLSVAAVRASVLILDTHVGHKRPAGAPAYPRIG